jgi:hypothetical protein
MKKIIFILFLSIGAGSIAQAQLLKNLKTKAKDAVDYSVDRSTNKVVDKTINNPADNITDTALDRAGKKMRSIFKKKNKKEKVTTGTEQAVVVPVTDTVAIKPPDQN